MMISHAVAEHDVLLGELQQHRVIKELVDADVLAETLSTENTLHRGQRSQRSKVTQRSKVV